MSRADHSNEGSDTAAVNVANNFPKVTPKYLPMWGAVYTEGWDRQGRYVKEEGKQLKTQINTQWIYPPAANRAQALAAADPLIPVVA